VVGWRGRCEDRDVALDPGDSSQVFTHQRRLPVVLGGFAGVLEVTAPTPTGMGVRTWGLHPLRTCLEHLDRVTAIELRGCFSYVDTDQLPRKCVAYEHHAAVLGPTDAATGGGPLDSHRHR
jgi:hypothetical protein